MQIWFIEPNVGDDLATNDVNSVRKRENAPFCVTFMPFVAKNLKMVLSVPIVTCVTRCPWYFTLFALQILSKIHLQKILDRRQLFELRLRRAANWSDNNLMLQKAQNGRCGQFLLSTKKSYREIQRQWNLTPLLVSYYKVDSSRSKESKRVLNLYIDSIATYPTKRKLYHRVSNYSLGSRGPICGSEKNVIRPSSCEERLRKFNVRSGKLFF